MHSSCERSTLLQQCYVLLGHVPHQRRPGFGASTLLITHSVVTDGTCHNGICMCGAVLSSGQAPTQEFHFVVARQKALSPLHLNTRPDEGNCGLCMSRFQSCARNVLETTPNGGLDRMAST